MRIFLDFEICLWPALPTFKKLFILSIAINEATYFLLFQSFVPKNSKTHLHFLDKSQARTTTQGEKLSPASSTRA